MPRRFVFLALICSGFFATTSGASGQAAPSTVRFAVFNAFLNRGSEGGLLADLTAGGNPQIEAVAEIIQRVRPDVLLLNEFDYDSSGTSLDLFRELLTVPQAIDVDGIDYPYFFNAPSNTGLLADVDLDGNGSIPLPGDGYGFGFFEGQFGMAVISRYPIDQTLARTFQEFLWQDMPGARLPDDASTPEPGDFYSPESLNAFRLSSKSHWDLPINIGGRTVHFLCSHPTPPVFDGPEDRNGLRNFDEIRFWADYITPGAGGYIYDDQGGEGGLAPGSFFVIAGDQNSDPIDGDSTDNAILQLLDSPLIQGSPIPSRLGGVDAAALQGGLNDTQLADPAYDTADFNDVFTGNLRVDYVLPRKGLRIRDSGVFWPPVGDSLHGLVGPGFPVVSSDHRLVWIDVKVPGAN